MSIPGWADTAANSPTSQMLERCALFFGISMNFKEFNILFKSHVFAMTYQKQCELAILICKKLFPDYKDFYQVNNWGDPDILIDAIKLCELYTEQKVNSKALREIHSKINSITPDTEDFGNASYALNACAAISETLEFMTDMDQNHMLNIGTYLTDTIDFKIQEDDELTEEQINSHPMMIEARHFLVKV